MEANVKVSPVIKAVLFDLDGTLLDRQAALEPFLRAQYDRCLSQSENIGYEPFRDRYLQLDECGSTSRPQLYQTLVTDFALKCTANALVGDFRAHIGTHSIVFPFTYNVLGRLRTEEYKLGIVTNGSLEAQSAKIRTCHLEDFVDTILISAQEGVKKPDAEIFHRAAEYLCVDPAECVFVGDNPRHDIHGAQAVSMITVWLKGCLPWPADLSVSPDYTINGIAEMLPILEKM